MLLVNVATFFTFGFDKDAAYKNKRRIPEKTLFMLIIMGGTIGGLLGMNVFHHKTSKTSFILTIGIIVILQIIAVYFYLFRMDISNLEQYNLSDLLF